MLKSLTERQFIIRKPLTYIEHTLLIRVVNPHYNSIVFVLFIFFFESYMLIFFLDDEHRVSKEGKSSYKESYTVDKH